jgi:hypothetical protein
MRICSTRRRRVRGCGTPSRLASVVCARYAFAERPTRASSRSLSTTSCGSRLRSRASTTTPCCRSRSLRYAQWPSSASSCEEPSNGSSGPTTMRVVSSMSSTDIVAQLSGCSSGTSPSPEAMSDVELQPRSSKSSTRRPSGSSASCRADTDILRASGPSSSWSRISTNVTNRATAAMRSFSQASARRARARFFFPRSDPGPLSPRERVRMRLG